MGKRILLAVAWGLATWTWVSMSRLVLNIPDAGPLAGTLVAAAIIAPRIFLTKLSGSTEDRGRRLSMGTLSRHG